MVVRGVYVYVFEGYYYIFLNYNDSGLLSLGKTLVEKIKNEMIKLNNKDILNFILNKIENDNDICISSRPVSEFVRNDMFIEWVYIINFDRMIFSVEDMYPTLCYKNYHEFDLYNIPENWIEIFSNEFYELFDKNKNALALDKNVKTFEKNEKISNNKVKCKWLACNDNFLNDSDVLKHIINDHVKNQKKRFICEWNNCNKIHKRREHLKAHIRRHNSYKSYYCCLCNNKYKHNSDIRRHIIRTHKEKRSIIHTLIRCN